GPLLLVAVALLGALGGAVPHPVTLSTLFSVPFDARSDLALSTGALYVVRLRQVRAYALPRGDHRWSTSLSQPVNAVVPMERAGVVLVVTTHGFVTALLALDARTGQVRWREDPAQVWGVLDGAGWVLLRSADRVRALDPATGRTVWEHITGAGWSLPDPDPRQGAEPWLVFQANDGTTEVVDAATGALRSRAWLPAAPPAEASSGTVPLVARSVVGSRLFVAVPQGDASVLAAYDLGTLDRQWRVTLHPAAYNVTACGSVLCVDGPDSVSGVDPGSGALLWTTGPWEQASPVPRDRLLISGGTNTVSLSVVDAHTLRPVLSLPGWYAVTDRLLARDGTDLCTWFAILDPSRARLRVLGGAWGVQTSGCAATDRYLACPDVHDQLRVWRYLELVASP
ncbi:MAG TPA: PQQ-binding-like beta-propeller repeat protein, partial [Rugosimonospora sp.]|nr:PQQ-binding-like beta-propeller repeat protein [Rugosimonospora sp.]